MEAVEYPLTIEQGSTFQKQFRWKVDGQVVDLTGYTAKMQARKSYGGPLGFELSTDNNRILLGGVAGTVALEMSPAVTSALQVGNYVYDLELYAGGVVRKFIRGTVVVAPETTIGVDDGIELIPNPPTGTYVLGSVNGTLVWLETHACV